MKTRTSTHKNKLTLRWFIVDIDLKRRRRGVTALLCFLLAFGALMNALGQSTKDLPPPTANLTLIPAGSLVIAMDNTNQAIGVAFNLKAYGLVNNLLQNSIPVMWAIKAGKAKDATDFSVNAARIAPSATAAANYNFAGGPFIVHRDFAELAKVRITAFANNVAVYQTTADVTVDIRYNLTLKPLIAVSNRNTTLHTKILDDASVPNYTTVDPVTLTASSCYTSHSEPHTTDTPGIPNVKTFVQSGGNFLAECAAVGTYENNVNGRFMSTLGITDNNVNTAVTYPNPDLAYSQFVGALDPSPGGSEQDWYLIAGSVFQNNAHIHADSGFVAGRGQEFAASAAKINGSSTAGGMVFYLGGHDWSGSSAIAGLNGERMYLNFILTPPTRPVGCGLDISPTLGSISGTIYEDVNGDSSLSDGVVRPNVNVRLYTDTNNNGVVDTGDIYLAQRVTDASGNYSFNVSTAGGTNYLVVVDSKSVTPNAGLNGGFTQGDVWAEETYGDDPTTASLDVASRFGGRQSAVSDNFNLSSTVPLNNTYEHVARVAVNGTNITNVNFGFSFNVVTNVSAGDNTDNDTSFNRTVQGSPRQFIQNANAIAGANSMRFVPAVAVNAGSWWRLTVTTALPAITDGSTTIDGQAYSNSNGTTVLDNNAGTVGTGGTVGVDALALSQVNKPEFEIVDGSTMTLGLDLQAANVTVKRLAIYGFGTTANNNAHANIRVGSFSGALIESNIIGTTASSFTDPGATRSAGDNVRVVSGASGILRLNVIGYSAGAGVGLEAGANSWQVTGNEIRGNAIGNSNLAGLDVNASGSATVTGNLIAGNEGAGVDSVSSAGSNSLVNNTITGNGVGTGASVVTPGVRLFGTGSTVDRNVLNANFGAGVMVTSSSSTNTITKNSIYANGTITNKGGAGPSNQIGIDLLSAGDNQSTGTSTFVTINDSGDGDAGGNGLLNFPVLTSARIQGSNLVLKGYARPGSAIEFFVAAADPTGFGEGQTYVVTLTEGSGADQDATTGTYTSPVNGLTVGTDTTNKFQFTIATPGGVVDGTKLTATATVSSNTSEFSGNVTVSNAINITGTVFEDQNYGGGAGRTLAASSGSVRSNARLELYTSAGAFSTSTTTDASGSYAFNGVAPGTYTLRVVSSTVTSGRTGYTATALAVQTYRTDASSGTATAVTDRVGGEDPAKEDAGSNTTSATLASLTTGNFTPQTITSATSTSDISGVDFGFNFDTVVNVNGTGQGSLRQFITNVNQLSNTGLAQSGRTAGIDNAVWMLSNGTASPGLRAAFNYFSGGVATITPSSALPTITDAVILDAQTQPGWTSTPIIQLRGTSAGAGAKGLEITAGGSTVRGLIINAFTGGVTSAGIWIATAGNNTIEANYIGTNAAGSAASANYQGIYVNNTSGNVIGGNTAAKRNILSGNTWRGIMFDNGASGNTVKGNYIGLDAGGTTAIANNLGINIWNSPNNTIGGTGAGDGNVISGNTQVGVYLVFAPSSGNTIQGNTIGLNAARSAAVPNLTQGVEICCAGNGGSNNTIGGTASGAANVISGNGGIGVRIGGGTGNSILTNAIYGNTGIGIDLGSDNVTVNNGTKNGALPNSDMDFPVFTSAVLSGTTLTVVGYVGNAPSQSTFANARVEIFKSDNDASGYGEGQIYLGFVTADANGNINTSLTVAGLSVGNKISATATDAANSTSEFNANFIVTAPAPTIALVKSVDPSGSQPPNTDLGYTVVFTNSGMANAQSLVISDPVPANTDFKVGSVATNLGTTGLTVVVTYSNDSGSTWTYTPVSGGGGAPAGYDRLVTNIRWTFTGNLSQTSPNNTGSVSFTARIR